NYRMNLRPKDTGRFTHHHWPDAYSCADGAHLGRRSSPGVGFLSLCARKAITGEEYTPPPGKPLTLATYEACAGIRAFIEPIAVGDVFSPMALFLRPEAYVLLPLEETYQAAWEAVSRRWRGVIERP